MDSPPLNRQLATHYLDAIRAGSLKPGDKLPSLRSLMRQHGISLSRALQFCRALESEGWLEARDRSGYFMRRPHRLAIATMDEPAANVAPDPAQYVGIHSKVSDFVARRGQGEVQVDFSTARGAPELYPGVSVEALEMAIEAYGHIKAVVVVPHLQNPLGSVMPDSHKQRLVELCERHAITLIEDDTYSEPLDAGAPPRAIKSWDRTGNVIHCASLHEVLAPGLRLGWISAGRWHGRVEMLKYTQTRSNEELAQCAAGEYMGTGAMTGICAACANGSRCSASARPMRLRRTFRPAHD